MHAVPHTDRALELQSIKCTAATLHQQAHNGQKRPLHSSTPAMHFCACVLSGENGSKRLQADLHSSTPAMHFCACVLSGENGSKRLQADIIVGFILPITFGVHARSCDGQGWEHRTQIWGL